MRELARAYAARAHVRMLSEDVDHLERALHLALESGLDGVAARAFNNQVAAGLRAHRHEVAERYVLEEISFAERRGLDLWLDHLRAKQMILDLDRGRWQRAADTATQLPAEPNTGASRV